MLPEIRLGPSFIETFGHATGNHSISTAGLAQYGLATLNARHRLRLADFTAPGCLARIGADSRLCAGEYDVAQRWSRAIYQHPYCVDGILYPARHDHNRAAAAVFDRAPAIDVTESHGWHDGGPLRPLLGQLLDHYGLALIETMVRPERKQPAQAQEMT